MLIVTFSTLVLTASPIKIPPSNPDLAADTVALSIVKFLIVAPSVNLNRPTSVFDSKTKLLIVLPLPSNVPLNLFVALNGKVTVLPAKSISFSKV